MKMLGVVLLIGIVAGFFVLKNDGDDKVLDDSVPVPTTALTPELESLKVAVIDMEKVREAYESLVGDSVYIEKLTEKIVKENQQKLDEIRKIATDIKEVSLDVEKGSNSILEPDQSKKEDLKEKQRRFDAHSCKTQSNREEWLRRRNKAINESAVAALRKRLSVIGELVSDYGEEAGVDYIFNSSTKRKESPIRSGVLIANDNQMDITEEIIERLKEKLSNKEGDE